MTEWPRRFHRVVVVAPRIVCRLDPPLPPEGFHAPPRLLLDRDRGVNALSVNLNDPDVRVTRAVLEVVSPNISAHVTRAALEVISEDDPNAHVTRSALEVISNADPAAHVTRAALEIIRSTATVETNINKLKMKDVILALFPDGEFWNPVKPN